MMLGVLSMHVKDLIVYFPNFTEQRHTNLFHLKRSMKSNINEGLIYLSNVCSFQSKCRKENIMGANTVDL